MRTYHHVAAALAGVAAIAPLANAVDFNISGFIRQEAAYKLTGAENPYNQHGNVYNGKAVDNYVYKNIFGLSVPLTRPDYDQDNDWNQLQTRAELDIRATFSDNLTGSMKIRGVYDWHPYNDFGDPSYFETPLRGDCGTRLEVCGDDYMVDLPSFYFDYTSGPFWVRVGNQQIAWGESLFFRVLDVPNGLDLRRHSILDWASEEYADERVPGLGVRASYRFQNNWEFEAFAQEFNPTIYPNENTPYNVIASQFVVQQKAGFDEVDTDWNFGARLRGQVGELGMQFIAVSRRNPDGVFRWTTSKKNPFVSNLGLPDVVLDSPAPGAGGLTYRQFGDLLALTPFEPFTGQGVYSAAEWFDYAGLSRLNGANLQQQLHDFPVAAALAQPVKDAFGLGQINNYTSASILLDTFFDQSLGGLGELRGHIDRRYPREEIFGFGLNYMFFGEPDSFIDQLIVRFEATYTPNKKFTDISLGQNYFETDEWATSLVLEKYQRFSDSFPATYMVLQWMHKSESDLFGRELDGFGGSATKSPPKGRDGYDAIAFALQQPSPSLIWRFDLAVLYDVKSGYLVQPGVRWKPSKSWTVEMYANFLDGSNNDSLGTLAWGDELGLRVGYQF